MKKFFLSSFCLGILLLAGCGSSDKHIQNPMIQITGADAAAEQGFSLEGFAENGFRIENKGDTLYLLSATEEGAERAYSYLLHTLTDEKGRVSLKDGEAFADTGQNIKQDVFIGDVSLTEYTLVYHDKNLAVAAEEFAYYLGQTGCGQLPVLPEKKASEAAHTIQLSIDKALPDGEHRFAIQDGNVAISGSDEAAVLQGVYLFLNTFLGWCNAGKEDAHLSNTAEVLHIPSRLEETTPWIAEREAIVTLWNINYSRGIYLNSSTSLKNNIIDFSADQLYEYVKMLKACGFTGIQVTDMCSAWAGAGGYENVHDKLRILADAAHSLDMKFTLWVWGSEFTGYGWVDDSVTYSFDGYSFAYENPDVVATFDKYYSIYAELADCSDRVIAHFYDPGNLEQSEDIAFFAGMLKDKFTAINPDIDFGVSCWVDVFNKETLVNALGNDITLYESGHHDNVADYETFRNSVNILGCRLGTWAWNTCEMEIDQMAQLNFNLDIIRSTYRTAREYDSIMKPSYWSEMDSYHVLNVFSLYCAGHLLIDPDMETETLLQNLAWSVAGDDYAEDFAEILLLIQDARSGPDWSSYWWNSESYLLSSPDYPAEDILNRCNTYIPVLQEMIDKNIETNTLPLPISLREVLQLMLPHLEQIRQFAEFRIGLSDLEEAYRLGTSAESLSAGLEKIATPIPEYNCIIGAWGQNEARVQQELIKDFCNRTGIPRPAHAAYDRDAKARIYAYFVTCQKGKTEPVYLYFPYYQYGLAYGADETYAYVLEMAEEGLLLMNEDKNGACLANWENYIYHFN